MEKSKRTLDVNVKPVLTEQDLMTGMGQCSLSSFLKQADLHLSREKFEEIVKRCSTLEEVRKYLQDLKARSISFDALAKATRDVMNDYCKKASALNFVFHGGFIDLELGKMSYLSNLSEDTANELAVLFFRNCKMSPLFCDVIVATYMLCKKAGLDKGNFITKK